jgi:hypothetical protein
MFVQSSDWHLSNLIWTERPRIFGDAYRAAKQIVDYAISVRDPLLILGDLFNTRRPEPEAVACFCEQMDRMETAGLPVYVTQGQHELNRGDVIWAGIHTWPKHVHKQSFEIGGLKFYGLDWLPRGELQEALNEIPPGTEYLVCHQVWEDFMGTNCATDGVMAEIPHVKYVLTGDFHSHCAKETMGRSGPVIAVSSGSTHLRAISEEYPKQFHHWQWPTGAVSVPIIGRELHRYEIDTPEELNDFLAKQLFVQCRMDDRRPIYYIRIRMDLPEWKSQIDNTVGDRAHVFYDPYATYDTQVEVSMPELQTVGLSAAAVMSGCAQSVVVDNPAVLAKVQAMLAHPDKGAAAAYWRDLYTAHMA